MCRPVIDVEAVTRNLARDDLAVEIDRLIRARNEGLCAARRGIVKLIVARVIAREPDIRILELVAAGVERLVARRIRVLRAAYVCEIDGIHRIAVIAHNCAIGNGLIRIRGKWCELRLVQRDVRLGLEHVRIDDGRSAVIDLIGCRLLEDVEIERCLGDGRPAMQIAEGVIVKFVVRRILAGKSNRTRELNSFIGTNILVRNQAGGFIDHLCLKVSGSKVQLNGVLSLILCGKARGAECPACESVRKCLGHVTLSVIHTVGIDRAIIELHLTLLDGHIDPAQVRAVLIRPEDCLRPGIADTVRLIEVLRRLVLIIVHLIEVNIAIIGDLVRLIADARSGCIHNLDILTVVGQIRDICAIVRLNWIGSTRIQSSVCFEIAIAVVRRHRPAHKRSQHWRRTALVDAPLRAGSTIVVDRTSPARIGGNSGLRAAPCSIPKKADRAIRIYFIGIC